jgi:phosphohistidine phosphatase SixA
MRLYFVRHGIAEDPATSDFARELTKRGRRRVAASAKVMSRLGIQPRQIFSSPRLRARQTAELIADALGMAVTLAETVNFGFDLVDVRSLIRHSGADDEVMFVGHNPDMSLLVSELTGVDASMKKGGLARIDIVGKTLEGGELVWLIAPKVFDALHEETRRSAKADDRFSHAPAQKLPRTSLPLHDLIKHRWSPVGFDRERDLDRATLMSILEAARWAASSSNLQPWRFIVAPRQNRAEFDKALSVLKEGNQPWAQHAAVLMIAVAHKYRKPDALNRHAAHDLGLAISQMVLQALDLGVYVHQMGGFFPEKAREVYAIPAEFEPFTAIALGYRTNNLDHLADGHREREAAPRSRQELSEMVFNGSWAQAADFLGDS